jgi:hypothetical protein
MVGWNAGTEHVKARRHSVSLRWRIFALRKIIEKEMK